MSSYLYVPGDKDAMVDKAASRGAYALILDLEDSVAPERKQQARAIVGSWLRSRSLSDGPEVWVRVNPGTVEEDVTSVAAAGLAGVYVAKADPELLRDVDSALGVAERSHGLEEGSLGVTALVESAAGVLDLRDIATGPRVRRLGLGEVDLTAELGMELSADAAEILPLRLQLVVVSAATGLRPPIGPVWTAIGDEEGLRSSSLALRRLGYVGRAAIHPAQIRVIDDVFRPSAEEIAAARETIRRHEDALDVGSGVTTGVGGEMIDPAAVRHARTLLDRAGERSPE